MASTSLDLAMRETAAARDRLTGIYGRVPAVVMFTQRDVDGPVRIGRALRLAGAVVKLHREANGPVIVRAAVPGERALEHWFRRRWGGTERVAHVDPLVVDFAREFGDRHAYFFERIGDPRRATVAAVRAFDPHLADLERLWQNGVTYKRIALMSHLTLSQVQDDLDRMRALGFDLPHRQRYGRRSDRVGGLGV